MFQSFSYGTIGNSLSEIPENVLNLFTSLVDNPNKKIEFASEIIDNGLAGRIRLDNYFNIDAYECTIRKNVRLGKEAKRKKVTFLDCVSGDYDDVAGKGGVRAETLVPKALQIQDAFEKVILDDELLYAVNTIKALDVDLQIEENIFIIDVIRQALLGVPTAIEKIKYICGKYKLVATQLETILSSGTSFEELFAT